MARYGAVIETRDDLKTTHGQVSDVLDDVLGLVHSLVNGDGIEPSELENIQQAVAVAQVLVDRSLNRADLIVYNAGMLFEAFDAGIRELKAQRDEILQELKDTQAAIRDPYWTDNPLVKELMATQEQIRQREAQRADMELMILVTENEVLRRQLSEVLHIDPEMIVTSFEE